MSKSRTYWHLAGQRRVPSAYEVASSRLHYYTDRGFEIEVPLGPWYERYQKASPFTCRQWEAFADPRATSYAKYVGLQQAKEVFVGRLFALLADGHYDRGLARPWLERLDAVASPLLYFYHGLQMVAAYAGQMAPASRITMAAAFQAADEMRRIQTWAYRLRQVQKTHTGFGNKGKQRWQEDALWQPLRRLVERLLVTYDWGEALVVLNLVVKPTTDHLWQVQLGEAAKQHGDYQLANILSSLHEDSLWHQEWSFALLRMVAADTPSSLHAVQAWCGAWLPELLQACGGFSELFGSGSLPTPGAELVTSLLGVESYGSH